MPDMLSYKKCIVHFSDVTLKCCSNLAVFDLSVARANLEAN